MPCETLAPHDVSSISGYRWAERSNVVTSRLSFVVKRDNTEIKKEKIKRHHETLKKAPALASGELKFALGSVITGLHP